MSKSNTFMDMPLSEGMMRTIKEVGFDVPTPIQQKSIPELLQGRDVLGQAQTGTGKTAAFAIPIIEMIKAESKDIQALVVCPTRELCLQVCQEIKRLSGHTKGISTAALYGGQAIDQQFRTLKMQKPQIIVATPGRLFDHLRRQSIDLSTVGMIVLDEADEMLDMGFRGEIEQIFDLLPDENQRLFFSATMPKPIMDLVHSYLRNPVIIKTESKNLTAPKVMQSFFRVRGKEKTELLCRVLDFHDPKLAVVFCNAKSTADEIVDEIKFRGFEAGVLHGDLSQNQRDRVMLKFKSGQVRVLVATDIAARGIDIDDIELVLNYHLPHDPEDYVHRIGRTGRAGRDGRAVSLVEARDNSRLRRISQFARADILEQEPPTINDVKSAKLMNLFGKVKTALSSEMIGEYRSLLSKQDITPEDMAAGMIKLALEKFDENARNDLAAEEMRGKRYSGYSPDKRQFDRSDRGHFGERPRRFDEQRNRRGDGFRKFDDGGRSEQKPRGEAFGRPRSYDARPARAAFADKGSPSRFGNNGKRSGPPGPERRPVGDKPARYGDRKAKEFTPRPEKSFRDKDERTSFGQFAKKPHARSDSGKAKSGPKRKSK